MIVSRPMAALNLRVCKRKVSDDMAVVISVEKARRRGIAIGGEAGDSSLEDWEDFISAA